MTDKENITEGRLKELQDELDKAQADRVDKQAQRASQSRRAPGIERVYAPGEMAFATHQRNAGSVTLSRQTFDSLTTTGKSVGIDVEALL